MSFFRGQRALSLQCTSEIAHCADVERGSSVSRGEWKSMGDVADGGISSPSFCSCACRNSKTQSLVVSFSCVHMHAMDNGIGRILTLNFSQPNNRALLSARSSARLSLWTDSLSFRETVHFTCSRSSSMIHITAILRSLRRCSRRGEARWTL